MGRSLVWLLSGRWNISPRLYPIGSKFCSLGNWYYDRCKNLLRKCKEKFEGFSGVHRGIRVNLLLNQIEKVGLSYNKLEQSKDFNWDMVPTLD